MAAVIGCKTPSTISRIEIDQQAEEVRLRTLAPSSIVRGPRLRRRHQVGRRSGAVKRIEESDEVGALLRSKISRDIFACSRISVRIAAAIEECDNIIQCLNLS